MLCLKRIAVATPTGEKHISVNVCDIAELEEPVDVLTVSAFHRSYAPAPRTLIRALAEKGIAVWELAESPEIDLRKVCNVWLSDKVHGAKLPVERIGCIELGTYDHCSKQWKAAKTDIVASIQAYFRMLDIASLAGMKMRTIGFPLIGTGAQGIAMDLIAIPLLSECIAFLRQNAAVSEIKILDRNPEKAYQFVTILENSYSMQREHLKTNAPKVTMNERLAFISYSSADKNIADNLCSKLESAGVRVWYAPRDIHYNDYASSIVKAITRCTHFIVIISKNSLESNHVLNEIDLAFQEMTSGKKTRFCPLKIDEETMGPAFRYYLSRQHWMDAHVPPIEKRLDEFVEKVFAEGMG